MKSIRGGNNRPENPRGVSAQKWGLLAKVHIAKKDLGLDDETYREILVSRFRVRSAQALSTFELEKLVRIFVREYGWIPSKRRGPRKESHLLALRDRIRETAGEISSDPGRLRGLSRSILGVSDPIWCNDPEKLKRLLAVFEKIKREEEKP
jgi:hypothetical protein